MLKKAKIFSTRDMHLYSQYSSRKTKIVTRRYPASSSVFAGGHSDSEFEFLRLFSVHDTLAAAFIVMK